MMALMTLTSFMEKIYSDKSTLSMIYIIGSILLFIFIVLLIFSLRKPSNKSAEIIEEPNIDNDEIKEDINSEEKLAVEEKKEEVVKEIDKPKVEITQEPKDEQENQEENNNLEDILNSSDENEETTTEVKEEKINNIISEIPSIDEYVDNIVNKTYEKNEQFSSVYVNTDTIKLEKVLDKLNVDDDIKEEIVPEDEKVQKEEEIEEKVQQEIEIENKLENLKKSLEETRNNVSDKQDELKNKLAALKNNNSNKLEDLKNKLDNLKNQ